MKHANLCALTASLLSISKHRIILTEHNAVDRSLASSAGIKPVLIGFGIRHMYGMADSVVAVSRGVAESLTSEFGLPAKLVQTIYNPVDTAAVRKKALEPAPDWWASSHTLKTIVAIGRLSKQKDYETLLAAFARLLEAQPARLIILGEGECRNALEARAQALSLEKAVVMPGYLENPYPILARADCFVLSSRWEGLPIVLLEAAALGIPIVSTDCPSGPREILGGIEGTRLVRVGDANEMARSIRWGLRRHKPIPALVERAEEFSVEHATDAYEMSLGLSS